jgi:hypothetical protein
LLYGSCRVRDRCGHRWWWIFDTISRVDIRKFYVCMSGLYLEMFLFENVELIIWFF